MNSVVAMATLILFLVSCGSDRKFGRSPANAGEYVGLQMGEKIEFNSQEEVLLQQICSYLRSKRIELSANRIDQLVKLEVSAQGCGVNSVKEEKLSVKITQPLSSGPLYLDGASDGNYFPTLDTDRDGFVAKVCQDIFNSETPKKLYDEGEFRYEWLLSRQDNLVMIALSKGVMRPTDTTPQFYTIEASSLRLLLGPQRDLPVERGQFSECTNGKSSSLVQIYD